MNEMKVHAPFTNAQAESFNAFQLSGVFHPFTCELCRDKELRHNSELTKDYELMMSNGMIRCKTIGCPYVQSWCWEVMTNWEWESYEINWTEKYTAEHD